MKMQMKMKKTTVRSVPDGSDNNYIVTLELRVTGTAFAILAMFI